MDRLSKLIKITSELFSVSWDTNRLDSEALSPFNIKGKIFCTWHENLLPVLITLRGSNMHILVSGSRDGRRIGGIAQSWGFNVIYGSSNRGGVRALRDSVKLLKSE